LHTKIKYKLKIVPKKYEKVLKKQEGYLFPSRKYFLKIY